MPETLVATSVASLLVSRLWKTEQGEEDAIFKVGRTFKVRPSCIKHPKVKRGFHKNRFWRVSIFIKCPVDYCYTADSFNCGSKSNAPDTFSVSLWYTMSRIKVLFTGTFAFGLSCIYKGTLQRGRDVLLALLVPIALVTRPSAKRPCAHARKTSTELTDSSIQLGPETKRPSSYFLILETI